MQNRFLIAGAAALAVIVASTVAVGVTGCSKKDAEKAIKSGLKEEAEIEVSGKLALSGEQTTGMNLTTDVALTDLSIYCVSFSFPPQAGTGSVAADGSFSVTINAAQVGIGCFILKGEEQVGTLVFTDPSKKGLSGEATTEQRQAFAGDANLGAIVLDLSTGKAEVDISQISVKELKNTDKAEKKAFDFSGTYKVAAAGVTLPTGYSGACPAVAPGAQRTCEGPTLGEGLWVQRIKGKQIDGGRPVFGIAVWDKKATFTACGSVLGMTAADATAAGIDLSDSAIPLGEFVWATGFVNGWKNATAVTQRTMIPMEPHEMVVGGVTYTGFKQTFRQYREHTCGENGCSSTLKEDSPGYSFNVNSNETGCKDASGRPAKVEGNWGELFQHSEGQSQNLGSGLWRNVQVGKVGTIAEGVTCVHIGGMFDAEGGVLNGWAQWPEDFDGGVTMGTLCSAMPVATDAERMEQLRCYADGFWKIADESRQSSTPKCLRELQTNWSAKTAAEFVEDNGPARAIGQHIFERFQYDSPDSGSFRQESIRYNGIQDGNMWTDCKVQETFTMSIRRIDGTDDLMAEMISDKRNLSVKPACIAAAASGEGKMGSMKALFKMVRTGD